jgi:hypothetical protein
MLSLATEAFARLDALHLAEHAPAEYIDLIIAIENSGTFDIGCGARVLDRSKITQEESIQHC